MAACHRIQHLQPHQFPDRLSRCAVWRSRSRNCTCCAASTSTSRPAASSRCSARTAPARPRSCGSCPRCSRPTRGRAPVNGFDVAAQAGEVRESISLTGQFAAVDEILTGRENLVLVARLRHLKTPGRIADDLLRRFSLTEAGDRRVATYSGGMRRRLDIAMSLIGDPPVIFLDEPTTGLDPRGTPRGVAGRPGTSPSGGTTVLLTTQYLDEAEQLADRIAILHEGRIIVNGTLAELKALLPPGQGRVRREAAHPRGRLPHPRRPRRHRDKETMTTDDHALPRRHRRPHRAVPAPHHPQPGHHHHHRDHADRLHAAVRLRLRRRDRHRHGLVRELPAARHPAHHHRVGHLLHRLPALRGHAGRDLRAVPLHADRPVSRCCGRTC